MTFYPNVFSEYLKFSIFSQNNDLPQTQSCKSTFWGVKDTDMPRKKG